MIIIIIHYINDFNLFLNVNLPLMLVLYNFHKVLLHVVFSLLLLSFLQLVQYIFDYFFQVWIVIFEFLQYTKKKKYNIIIYNIKGI